MSFAGGTFSYPVKPSIYTNYVARWNGVASGNVVAQVAPAMHLMPGENGYMRATIVSPVSLWHRHVYLQRLSSLGQWVNVAALDLGEGNGEFTLAYVVRAVTPGEFTYPALVVEDMYEPETTGRTAMGKLSVQPR